MSSILFSRDIVEVLGIPVYSYGSLRGAEEDFLSKIDLMILKENLKLLELAKEISLTEGISEEEALNVVEQMGDRSKNIGVMIKYADRIPALAEDLNNGVSRERYIAAYVFANRVIRDYLSEARTDFLTEYNFDVESAKTYQDFLPLVKKIPAKVVRGMALFFMEERKAGNEFSKLVELPGNVEQEEEIDPKKDLGKQSRHSKKGFKKAV